FEVDLVADIASQSVDLIDVIDDRAHAAVVHLTGTSPRNAEEKSCCRSQHWSANHGRGSEPGAVPAAGDSAATSGSVVNSTTLNPSGFQRRSLRSVDGDA